MTKFRYQNWYKSSLFCGCCLKTLIKMLLTIVKIREGDDPPIPALLAVHPWLSTGQWIKYPEDFARLQHDAFFMFACHRKI